ncbi:MAG: hypothetical protein KF789_02200 [Bdellovibrionaceae bacterium]|nr:hypothetical protein [Pseudobdellovibrionaceae bacterium]
MDLKKLNGLESLQPQQPVQKTPNLGSGPSFRDTLLREVTGNGLGSQMPNPAKSGLGGADGVKFSNHAIERMRTRGISFNPEDLKRLEGAIEKAAAKGSKDSLILMNESALIVSVKNNTVVTVMDKNALKENVFTNIDSTIVM